MAKLTLLEVIKDIQSSMDFEEANDIDETEEAQQITKVCRSVFNELIGIGDWAHFKQVKQLTQVGDINRPTLLSIPSGVTCVRNFKYEDTESGETNRTFKDVAWLDTGDFLDKIYRRRTDASNTEVFDTAEGIPITVLNDIAPSYWTTFDDSIVICDSYNAESDTTLVSSKTIVEVQEDATFTMSNTFNFEPMPNKMFPTYLARCRTKAHEYFLDQLPQTDVQEAARGLARLRYAESRVGEPRKRKRTFGRRK
jgi:hypothetical protein